MVDTITRTIILHNGSGKVIKNLKSGTTTQVKVYNTPIYKIQDKNFSNK